MSHGDGARPRTSIRPSCARALTAASTTTRTAAESAEPRGTVCPRPGEVVPTNRMGVATRERRLMARNRERVHLTTCASAAGACGAAARPPAEHNRAAAPRIRPGQQQARVRQCPGHEWARQTELTCLE